MTPEFTWSRDTHRDGWVIRRRGMPYLTIPRDPEQPAMTETYVQRWVARLNGETHG
ncbi:MAG: hypothetical protein KC442_03405 [Thermomicrobiales bacterium]|nr:hypothetical protein [Thermomicrobiales bacterium]MCB0059353.1 hypothetical protein [Caldilineaceae bacterium]